MSIRSYGTLLLFDDSDPMEHQNNNHLNALSFRRNVSSVAIVIVWPSRSVGTFHSEPATAFSAGYDPAMSIRSCGTLLLFDNSDPMEHQNNNHLNALSFRRNVSSVAIVIVWPSRSVGTFHSEPATAFSTGYDRAMSITKCSFGTWKSLAILYYYR